MIRQKLQTIDMSKAELDRGRLLAEEALKGTRAQLAEERAWAVHQAEAQAKFAQAQADEASRAVEAVLMRDDGIEHEKLRDEIEALATRLEEAALGPADRLHYAVRKAAQRLAF